MKFFVLTAITTVSRHGTLAFAFPTSLATLRKATGNKNSVVSLKVMARGYGQDGYWDDRPWVEEPRYSLAVDYDYYEDEWEPDGAYDRRPHRQTYRRREFEADWEPDNEYDRRPRSPPRPAPRNNQRDDQRQQEYRRRDFERAAPQRPARRQSLSSPDYPPLPPPPPPQKYQRPRANGRQAGDYNNGRAPHNQDIRQAVSQDGYESDAGYQPRRRDGPQSSFAHESSLERWGDIRQAVSQDGYGSDAGYQPRRRDGPHSSFAHGSSWERWGDSRSEPQFEYGEYYRKDFNYWPPGRNDLEQRRQLNEYDRNGSRRNGSRYLYPSRRSDRDMKRSSMRMGFGYGGIKRFFDGIFGYDNGPRDPMTKRVDSEINRSIIREQRTTKALLQDARYYLLADPEVTRMVGDSSSISLGSPYSQDSSKTMVNGVTKSRLQLVIPIAGSRATGRVLLVADQDEITSLEVEVGGRVVDVPLDVRRNERLEDVVDVNVVDKTTYL